MSLDELDITTLTQIADHRGMLMPVEFADLPFVPQRMFMVVQHGTFDPENRVRGKHANKECRQYFYCIAGEVAISLFDGKEKKTFHLRPGQGLLVDKMIWNSYLAKTMLGHIGIYIVLASHPYDANDYLTDIDEFKRQINAK